MSDEFCDPFPPMKYDVVTASTPADLAAAVSAKLEDGWIPHGSPFFFPSVLCQAVIFGQDGFGDIATAIGEITSKLDDIENAIGRK